MSIIVNSLLLILFLCVGLTATAAQSKPSPPDINGSWILNTEETKIDGFKLEVNGLMRAEIKQTEPRISLIVTGVLPDGKEEEHQRSVYFTDNRGESNTSRSGERSSKTRWKNNKLNIEISTGDRLKKEKEEWWLSKDNNKLFRKITINTKIEYQINGKAIGEDELKTHLLFVFDRSR